MMHHWTPQGWVSVLGADWKYSYWEGQCGTGFLLETQARSVGEDRYYNLVHCLTMIGSAVMCEPALDRMTLLPNPGSFWCSLALMTKHILAKKNQAAKAASDCAPSLLLANIGRTSNLQNIIHRRLTSETEDEDIVGGKENKIVIPAASCSEPRQSTNNVQFTKSFLGGRQLHHTGGDVFEYTLTDLAEDQAGTYNLVLRVCTVHLKQQPLLLTISCNSGTKNNSGDDDVVDVVTIVVPYTVGEWQYTDPVAINLAPGTNVLSFSRETPNFGLTIKDITCTLTERFDSASKHL